MEAFSLAALPQLEVGPEAVKKVPAWLEAMGHEEVLLCIGGSSLERSGQLGLFLSLCVEKGIQVTTAHVAGEPSPEIVDAITEAHLSGGCSCVIGIGGGSVIDAAKAVSAMLAEGREHRSCHVKDYLEGVGTLTPSGMRVGLIAVPTTSGTGTEATKNAVISSVGENGFKKSLRHMRYVPDLAVLDGTLSISCPRSVSAASGLDAVTQLLEAYVSTKASPFTDALAIQGLSLAGRVLPGIIDGTLSDDMEARTQMAYAAYLSGVTLANADLGVVHGAASPLGAAREIPHGVVCGTLVRAASETVIRHLKQDGNSASLLKYAQAGYALMNLPAGGIDKGLELLVEVLSSWEESFGIQRLGEFGFSEGELKDLSKKTGLKNTPAALTAEEIHSIFCERL